MKFPRVYKPGYTRLNDEYNPDFEKIENNSIFGNYKKNLHDALRSPGDWKSQNETINKENFIYELSKDEIEFYERLFVPSRSISLDNDPFIAKLFPRNLQQKVQIGINEKNILEIIRLKENKLFILVSPIGWGKTVILKRIWLYLIGKSSYLKNHTIPVYISLDQRDLYFNSSSRNEIRKIILNQFLIPRLLNVSEKFTSLNEEDFWKYLLEANVCFIKEKRKYDDYLFRYEKKPEILIEKIYDLREKLRDHEFYYLYSTKFIVDEYKKKVIVIFDNVDLFPIEVQEVILGIATELIEDYGINCIVSLRDDSYNELTSKSRNRINTFPKETISIDKRNVKEYLEKRLMAVFEGIDKDFSFVHRDKIITHPNSLSVIKELIEILFKDKSSDFLDFLSFHNLRYLNELLELYLSTGYVEQENLVEELINKLQGNKNSYYQSPLYVLLSSILTANHKTHFSSPCENSYILRRILNIFYNSKGEAFPYLIRFHLLNFLHNNPQTTTKSIVESFQNLYKNTKSENNNEEEIYEINSSINHALERFFDCQIITSPQKYKLEEINEDNIIININSITLTDTGEYYFRTLTSYFEYLIFLKDDVVLPNDLNILDSIKVTNRRDRFEVELIKFLRFIFEQETSFFKNLDIKQRELYIKSFSRKESNCVYNVLYYVENMIEYGRQKLFNVSKYEMLKNEILSKCKLYQ